MIAERRKERLARFKGHELEIQGMTYPHLYETFRYGGCIFPKSLTVGSRELVSTLGETFSDLSICATEEGKEQSGNVDGIPTTYLGPLNLKLSSWTTMSLPVTCDSISKIPNNECEDNDSGFEVNFEKGTSVSELDDTENVEDYDLTPDLLRLVEQEGRQIVSHQETLETINLGNEENKKEVRIGYNQIKMASEDREKTTFITMWGTFCYKVMPFGLKNTEATYQRAMVTLFHDMMHREVEVYVDDMIVKVHKTEDHETNLERLFKRLRKFQLRLNLTKCTFGVTSGRLLGFIVSERGIEVDPDKVQAIRDLSPPKTQKEVRGFLEKLNYIARFISQLTLKCDPILKLLHKHNPGAWNEECQVAFDKVKEYLLSPPVLVPLVVRRPLFLYLTINEGSIGCVLGQHDETGKKEMAVYYLSKKFTEYESKYSSLEKMCCALAWTVHRLRQYMLYHTTWLIAKLDPIKYIFKKPSLSGRVARWQVLLSEYDIVYVSQKAIKGSAIANFLAERVEKDYEPMEFEFSDEDLMSICQTSGGKSEKRN
ncbi:Reverse transcriptase domain - like 10 [Theobroma cacao]|nr:Reverse transcriptase domain - like 10 [Theobroma cacao]